MSARIESAAARPGCVTLYAVLTGVGGALALLALLISLLVDARALPLITYLLGFIFGVLGLVIAVGLWQLEQWARVAVIALTGLGTLGNILSICAAASAGNLEPLADNALEIAVGIYIIHWFGNNREAFAG